MRWRAAVFLCAVAASSAPSSAAADIETREAELTVDGAPVEVREAVGYRRGRPSKLEVVTIGWVDVELRTAKAFVAMYEAAAESGIELFILSGFRTYEDQERFYRAYREGWGNKAARPGYSNHQSGRALDIYLGMPGALEWLEANARRFGFKRTVRSEPWHWEYTGHKRSKGKQRPAKRSQQRTKRSGT